MSSSSSKRSTDVANKDNNDNLKALLDQKDEEIKRLKTEIEDYKAAISQLQQDSASAVAAAEGVASMAAQDGSGMSSTKMEARWKARFQQLVAYKLEHGNCNVPKSYKDKSLHAWVRTQREAKKFFYYNKGGSMTQERLDALNSIGFQWVVGHQSNDSQWENMFQALLEYKQQHGHTRVSANENKQLYKWVLNQRARRRLLEKKGEGKAKGMTYARVAKLTAIEFTWDASSRHAVSTSTLEREVQEWTSQHLAASPTRKASTATGTSSPAIYDQAQV